MKLPFLPEIIAENMWRAFVCDQRPNVVLETLRLFFLGEKYMSVEEHESFEYDGRLITRWKREWRWRNRGSFWDKLASE